MDFRHFPLDKFLAMREVKEKQLQDFYDHKGSRIAVVQKPGYYFTRAICRYRDKQLESELDFIADAMRYHSDFMFSALEPWVGVGVYASAFGCKYEWTDHDAPQTRPILESSDEIADIKIKKLSEWEEMQEVLTRIKYFKEATHGQMGITLTDTQSPNDTASLIMDTSEFFADCLAEPEAVAPLLSAITDKIIEYSRIQYEVIGDQIAGPGHIAICGRGINGVTLSDDNLAILSPESYKNSSAEYMERISKAFGGLYVHSCGKYYHNIPEVLKCSGLRLLDCAVDNTVDPNPNSPAKMAEMLKGNDDIILQVRLGIQNASILKPLLESGLRLIIQFSPLADADESNRLFDKFKEDNAAYL